MVPSLCRFGVFSLASLFVGLTGLAAEPAPVRQSPPNTEPLRSGEPMDGGAAAEVFEVPDGFRVSLFAAEPVVQNPIAMTLDPRGRLWVAENYTYSDRTEHFNLALTDRVVVLDGTDGDHASSHTVFTEDVQMLTGIEVAADGVYLMCPPNLLFLPDADHDDVPDGPAKTILDGFTVADANYHNFANGIRFGPDGWLYGRCGGSCPGRIGKPGTPDEHRLALEGGIWRYHPRTEAVEVLTTGTCNPWGHDFDDLGEGFFINTVNGHFWHLIEGAHFTRPFTLDPNRLTYELIDTHADHWHFDTTGAWHESRAGAANAYGGGHAHCGLLIYNDTVWPDRYRGKAWTLNFHGRRINQETIRKHGSGFIASHDDDFAVSGDPWFRGMDLLTAPDGNVLVIDWSDTGECHEHDGVHRTSGRVFKISHDRDGRKPSGRDMRTYSDDQLLAAVVGPRGPLRRMAIPVWADRASAGELSDETLHTLSQSLEVAPEPVDLLRRLWALDIAGKVDAMRLEAMLRHPGSAVRAATLRMASQHWPIDDAMGAGWKPERRTDGDGSDPAGPTFERMMPQILTMAESDDSPRVRLQLASMMQRLPVERRPELARRLVRHAEDAGDHNTAKMIWYGLIPVLDERPESLVDVAAESRLAEVTKLISRALAEADDAAVMDRLLTRCEPTGLSNRRAVLEGMVAGYKGLVRAEAPNGWTRFAESFGDADETSRQWLRELGSLFGDGRALDDLRAIAMGTVDADDATRTAALESLILAKPADLREICRSLLKNPKLNVVAARGLAAFDDPALGRELVSRYRNFRAPERPKLVSVLVSRSSFADPLLDAIEQGKIPRQALTAFDVRAIHSLQNDAISERVDRIWGRVRQTTQQAEQEIERLKNAMDDHRLAAADRSQGRVLFNRLCSNCHRLYGEGAKVGPDLTGAGRSNLDYLVSNIIAPSAVVDKDFRMTVIATDDGRTLSGLVLDESPSAIEMQTATEKVTVPASEVLQSKQTDLSPMPEGLFANLSDDQIADLLAYLQHPTQVPLPE